ncbi:Biotin biosynthesis bifunctional protein BioHC, partial [Trichinella spiralis]
MQKPVHWMNVKRVQFNFWIYCLHKGVHLQYSNCRNHSKQSGFILLHSTRLDTRLQPEQLSLLIPELKGVSIHTTHRNQDRIYRIKDILSTA